MHKFLDLWERERGAYLVHGQPKNCKIGGPEFMFLLEISWHVLAHTVAQLTQFWYQMKAQI